MWGKTLVERDAFFCIVHSGHRKSTDESKHQSFTPRVNANVGCAHTYTFSHVWHWQRNPDSNTDAGKNRNLLHFIPGNVAVTLTLTLGMNGPWMWQILLMDGSHNGESRMRILVVLHCGCKRWSQQNLIRDLKQLNTSLTTCTAHPDCTPPPFLLLRLSSPLPPRSSSQSLSSPTTHNCLGNLCRSDVIKPSPRLEKRSTVHFTPIPLCTVRCRSSLEKHGWARSWWTLCYWWLRPNPHWTRATNSNANPLMLLACSVDTPIHINRFHLLCAAVDWAEAPEGRYKNRQSCRHWGFHPHTSPQGGGSCAFETNNYSHSPREGTCRHLKPLVNKSNRHKPLLQTPPWA